MFRIKFCALILMMTWLCLPANSQSKTERENGALLASALRSAESKNWKAAQDYASQTDDPLASEIILWVKLRRDTGGWEDYTGFLARNPDWPGLKPLRKAAESVMPDDLIPTKTADFFVPQPPQTGAGALKLAKALSALGQEAKAAAHIIAAWQNLPLSAGEQGEILAQYDGLLAAQHQLRLENMLWQGQTRQAEAMLPLVDPGQQQLARARIGLQRTAPGIDALIAAVPDHQAMDGGLAYDRFNWRIKKGRWDDANALLVERTARSDLLGRPEKWGTRRRGFARRAMRSGDVDTAYWLASQHGLSEGADYADLEWLAGYLALRKLDAPEQALTHFTRFRAAVKSPISLGRAGYWLGTTHEALGHGDHARTAFEFAAKHQTSFYGQLAAEKLDDPTDASLAGAEPPPDYQTAEFMQSDVVKAGLLLKNAGRQRLMGWFFTHKAESLPVQQQAQLAALALNANRPNVALRLAKQLAKTGVVLIQPYFPVTGLAEIASTVPAELRLAIARRESEFDATAGSPAGARGLMQIMPGTAKLMAAELGLDYDERRLTLDWRYNAELASGYLDKMLARFDGNYLLASGAYNAGPGRVEQWITTYGDPRTQEIDPIDWIEHIPYRETRNYVMRVLESLHVYRARLAGETPALTLSEDISGS